MKKRSQFISVFKIKGIRWTHSRYWKNGSWRHCYAPDRGSDAIFSKTPLTMDQLKLEVRKTEERWERIINKSKAKLGEIQ